MNRDKYEIYAKESLNILVKIIKNYNGEDKFITYGKLAELINFPLPHTGSNFGKEIGKTLGIMGHLLDDLTISDWKGRIPYIQSMVVRSDTKLPSDGLKEFYPFYPSLTKDKKTDFLECEYQKIFDFGERWFFILEQLNIISLKEIDSFRKKRRYNSFGSEGSPEHRKLRNFISKNPEILNFKNSLSNLTEYPLKSGDSIDVLFKNNEFILGIEVKSLRSGQDDLKRGIFQCIKYREILKAEELIKKSQKKVDCYLVYEGKLGKRLTRIAKTLSVKTINYRVNY